MWCKAPKLHEGSMVLLDTHVVILAQVSEPFCELLSHCSREEPDIEGLNKILPSKCLGCLCPGLRLISLISLCSQLEGCQSNSIVFTGNAHSVHGLLHLPEPLLCLNSCTLSSVHRRTQMPKMLSVPVSSASLPHQAELHCPPVLPVLEQLAVLGEL